MGGSRVHRTGLVAACLTCLWGYAAQPPTSRVASAPSATAAVSQRQDQIRKWLQYITEENTLATRRTACAEMLETGWPEAVDALVEVLTQSRDPLARLAACEAIAAAKAPPAAMLDPLRVLLDDPDPRLREASASALGAYRDGAVLEMLARELADTQAPTSRRLAAVRGLTCVHDVERAIDVLIRGLDEPEGPVRSAVLDALRRVAPVDCGQDGQAWRRWWAEGRRDLLSGLNRKLREQQQRYEALESRYVELLRLLFDSTAPEKRASQLLDWFKSPLAVERRAAVAIVGQEVRDAKPPAAEVAAAIRRLISDPDPRVRREVVLTIRDFRQPETSSADTTLLLDQLSRENDRLVEPAIYNALGRLEDPRSIPVCIAGLNDPDEEVVAEAVTALGWLAQKQREAGRNAEAVAEAIARRFTPLPASSDLRQRVVEAMAKTRDARFAPVLQAEAAQENNSAAIRVAAVRGLGMLDSPGNLDVIAARLDDKDAGVREAALKAMAALGATPEHLRLVRARLDPAVETTKTMQSLAWEACRAIFARLPAQNQIAILREFDGQADGVAAERYAQLITILEERLSGTNPAPPELAEVRVRTGDALVRVSRDADAAAVYEKALAVLGHAPAEKRQEVFLKLVRTLLRAGQFDKCVELLNGGSGPTADSDVVAAAIIEHVASLTAAGRADQALEAIQRLQPVADRSFKPNALVRLAELRRDAATLQARQDQENVRRWIADLQSGGEAAAKASVMLRQLGPRAVRPIREHMRTLVTTRPAQPALEQTLLDLLRQLAPEWGGYPAGARPDEKLKALDLLGPPAPAGG